MNRDPLDCRRANLKVRSRSGLGQRNRKPDTVAGKKCTSKYKGVCLHKTTGLWIAQTKRNRVKYYLGYFRSEVDAAKAYDDAVWKMFGPQAYLNFPERFADRHAA